MANASAAPKILGSGSLSATGSTDSLAINGAFNFTLSGTWVGTVALEASVDNNVTFVNCLMPDGTASAFAINGLYVVPNALVPGTLYRLTFTRTSGTADWSISQ